MRSVAIRLPAIVVAALAVLGPLASPPRAEMLEEKAVASPPPPRAETLEDPAVASSPPFLADTVDGELPPLPGLPLAPDGAAAPPVLPLAGSDASLESVSLAGPWRLRSLGLEGLGLWRGWQTRSSLLTRTRPWWRFWDDDAPFDPGTFSTDLERVRRELLADGDYEGEVRSEIHVLSPPGPPVAGREGGQAPGVLAATIVVDPGVPVRVCSLEIGPPAVLERMLEESPRRAPWPGWLKRYLPPVEGDLGAEARRGSDLAEVEESDRPPPLERGAQFTEDAYQAMAAALVNLAEARGYPHPVVDRAALVDVPGGCVAVSYTVTPGFRARFAGTTIEGLQTVDEQVVRNEIAWKEGRLFDDTRVAETRRRLRNLRLFSIVKIEPGEIAMPGGSEGDPYATGHVSMRIRLRQGAPREFRVGLGYSTEEQFRGQVSWRDWNFLGGARQLGVALRASQVTRWAVLDFVQPHFPAVGQRAAVSFNLGQDDESTYLLDYSRILPRLDFDLGRGFAARLLQRTEYDSLSGVSDQTREAVPGYRSSGFTVAAGGGIEWTHLDELLDPRRGVALGFSGEAAGAGIGSDFDFFRTTFDVRAYRPLPRGMTLASRLRFGTIVPFGNTDQIQLWERFYAGGTGINPVRGYARRRIGPLSGSNDPLGGRSMLLGSIELRYPLFGPLQAAAFVDLGDIEPSAWQVRPQEFQFGVGPGLRAMTPLGPVSLDIGFGLDRPRGDSLVQVGLSIGPVF